MAIINRGRTISEDGAYKPVKASIGATAGGLAGGLTGRAVGGTPTASGRIGATAGGLAGRAVGGTPTASGRIGATAGGLAGGLAGIASVVGGQKSPKASGRTTAALNNRPSYGGSINYGGGGGSYGGGSYGGGAEEHSEAPSAAPVVTPPTKEDYLAGDSGYQTQLSALQSALQRYLADSDFQRKNYETDYGQSLRDLGYDEGKKAWNWTDQLTASGRGYQNQLNDFGARGMLQSSGYADSFNELQRMLNQQYNSLSSAKTTYMTDLDNQIANYKGENTSSQQAARAEALARRAAQYGIS